MLSATDISDHHRAKFKYVMGLTDITSSLNNASPAPLGQWMCSEAPFWFGRWTGHQEGMRSRKEAALVEHQALCFNDDHCFLLRWVQAIKNLRTHDTQVNM